MTKFIEGGRERERERERERPISLSRFSFDLEDLNLNKISWMTWQAVPRSGGKRGSREGRG